MKILLVILFIFSSAQAADDGYWFKLLHYRKNALGQLKSEVDAKDFFISPDGKSDPAKEMVASIDMLNSAKAQDFVCRFPLRYRWLKSKMKNNWSYTTESCEIYNAFVGKLGAKNLSLVFSSFFVNNPGSTFGHTFIHISRYEEFRTNELLDYAINFAAQESSDFVLFYMLKGLAGFYPGKFSVVPYYYKIREYNDSEFRDIWDYDLDLNQEQINRVIDHVWELGSAHFDYYYFTENCSYHVLGLLNVAYDDVDLLDKLPALYILPIDTVKEMKRLGLIKDRKVRGSAYGRLLKETEDFSHNELAVVKEIAQTPSLAKTKLASGDQKAADLLDASISAMDYLKAEAILTNQKKETEERRELLVMRAENPIISDDIKFDENKMAAPDDSHASSRLGLSSGYRLHDGAFQNLEWRAAQHELLDPSYGQLKYSQVTMFEWKLRQQSINYSKNKLVLDSFRLADIKKYQPSDYWNQSIAWDLGAGLSQRRECVSRDCLNPIATFGVGSSTQVSEDVLLTFLFGGNYVHEKIYENDSLLGLGPKVNFLLLKDKYAIGIDAAYLLPTELFDGWLHRRLTYDFDLRYFWRRNTAFFLKSNHIEQDAGPVHESQIGVYFYH